MVPAEVAAIRAYFVLPDGVFLYNPLDHTMQQVTDEDQREALAAALLNQAGAPTGGCQIILTASAQEFNRLYGTRGRTVMRCRPAKCRGTCSSRRLPRV